MINVKNKDLPLQGADGSSLFIPFDITKPPTTGNYLATTDPALIIKTIQFVDKNRTDIEYLVLDDYQYILSEAFMAKALQTGFDKFNILGKNGFDIINAGITMTSNKFFIMLTHDDEENGKSKMKLLGKMLEDKVNPIGLFTIALFTTTRLVGREAQYYFITNRSYDDRGILVPAKSPVGMFEDLLIPNDLGLVVRKIKEYYNGNN